MVCDPLVHRVPSEPGQAETGFVQQHLGWSFQSHRPMGIWTEAIRTPRRSLWRLWTQYDYTVALQQAQNCFPSTLHMLRKRPLSTSCCNGLVSITFPSAFFFSFFLFSFFFFLFSVSFFFFSFFPLSCNFTTSAQLCVKSPIPDLHQQNKFSRLENWSIKLFQCT